MTLAVQYNIGEVVDYLISKGAKTDILDKDGNNLAYYLFTVRGNTRDFDDKVKALRQAGVDFAKPQPEQRTVWHLAMDKNDLDLLKKVQAFGADTNATTEFGETAYELAQENELLGKTNVDLDFLN